MFTNVFVFARFHLFFFVSSLLCHFAFEFLDFWQSRARWVGWLGWVRFCYNNPQMSLILGQFWDLRVSFGVWQKKKLLQLYFCLFSGQTELRFLAALKFQRWVYTRSSNFFFATKLPKPSNIFAFWQPRVFFGSSFVFVQRERERERERER